MTALLLDRVAEHIGANRNSDGTLACPVCAGDFGPTISVLDIAACYVDYLPGAPLLAGVCLDCGHITEPAPKYDAGTDGPVMTRDDGWTAPAECEHNLPAGNCPACATQGATR